MNMDLGWMSFALFFTILVEYGMLLLLGEKRRKVLLSSIVVNVLTNVPLNLYMLHVDGGWMTFVSGELLVVLVEALWYLVFVRKASQAVVYSVLCNAASCLFGLLVQLVGWICSTPPGPL